MIEQLIDRESVPQPGKIPELPIPKREIEIPQSATKDKPRSISNLEFLLPGYQHEVPSPNEMLVNGSKLPDQ